VHTVGPEYVHTDVPRTDETHRVLTLIVAFCAGLLLSRILGLRPRVHGHQPCRLYTLSHDRQIQIRITQTNTFKYTFIYTFTRTHTNTHAYSLVNLLVNMHVHTYTYPHTLHTQENYSEEEAQRWMEHRNVALSEMSLSLSPLLKTLLFELLPTWISGRLCTLIEGSQTCLHACVSMWYVMHASMYACMHVRMYASMYMFVCFCVRVCVYRIIYVYTHTRAHAHTHTPAHAYPLSLSFSPTRTAQSACNSHNGCKNRKFEENSQNRTCSIS